MKDRMEQLVLLPFRVGCLSESSIPVVAQHSKRSRLDLDELHPTPTSPSLSRNSLKHTGMKEEQDECLLYRKSSSGEFLKTTLRFRKLLKNFRNVSQIFVYKDDELEPEMAMDIGLPTDVKHVTHIGLDDCAASPMSSKGWDNLPEAELINLHYLPLTPLELAMTAKEETPSIRSLLEKPNVEMKPSG